MAKGLETRFYADFGSLITFKKDKEEVTGYVVKFDDKKVWLSQESPHNLTLVNLFFRERAYNLKNFESYNILSTKKW